MRAVRVAAIILLFGIVSCGPRTGQERIALPDPVAEEVWAYVVESEGYSRWQCFPEGAGLYRSESPHGDHLKLFINTPARNAFGRETFIPRGAILVQENYSLNGEILRNITLMYKVAGYNPDQGDWFWAKYDPTGNPLDSGRVNSCIQCHRMLGENYIIPGRWLATLK